MKRSANPAAGAKTLRRRLVLGSAAVLAAALAGFAAYDAGFSVAAKLRRVDRALAAGRVDEARKLLDLKTGTDDPRILTRYARLRLIEKRPDSVVRLLADRVADRPDPEWLEMLGEAQAAVGDLDGALKTYRTLASLRPDHRGALEARGVLAHRLGSAAEAIEAYRELERLEPTKADWPRNLGRVAMEVDAADLAVSALRRAVKLDSGDLDLRFGLAEALYLSGDVEAGLAEIDRCLASRPDDPRLQIARAECLRDLGRAAESVEAIDRVLARDADHVQALRLRAEHELETGDRSKALERLERARDRDPLDWRVHYALSRVYDALKRPDDARNARASMAKHQAASQIKPGSAAKPDR